MATAVTMTKTTCHLRSHSSTKPMTKGKTAKRKTREDNAKEPFMYHCMKPTTLYQEFLHAWNIQKVISLTPGDVSLLHGCIVDGIPAIAFCFSDRHKEVLKDSFDSSIDYVFFQMRHMADLSTGACNFKGTVSGYCA